MNLQQPRSGGNFNKIPFKISNKTGEGKREDACVSGPQVRNNFFTEGEKHHHRADDAGNYEDNNENRESVDTSQNRQLQNISQLSAPMPNSSQQSSTHH